MTDWKRATLGGLERDFPAIKIGQFYLEECVGEGGMGEVWRGRHVEQGTEVAIKVILTEQALNDRFRIAFRQEARSVAGLSHPFVIDVVDYGTVDEEIAESSVGRLRSGSPYLVMEYAKYGSLQGVMNQELTWSGVKLLVFSLLDALAHSHARGMVHRDIKPQNVLLTETINGWPGVRLTDFGLAYALWDSRLISGWHRMAGTPEYMAPEQVLSDWRNYGAATDLYGLGCLVYLMVTGATPFDGNNIFQIAKAHVEASVPPISTTMQTPDGLDDWLGVMLAKKPSDRFPSAAAAAYALRQICGPFDEMKMSTEWANLVKNHTDSSDEPTQTMMNSLPIMPTHTLDSLLRDRDQKDKPAATGRFEGAMGKLKIPSRWKHRRGAVSTVRLVGTGMGLFGLRRLPLLGRERQQEELWSDFRRCAREEKPQVLLVQGAAGVGKDYLAEWFCDRVLELGVGKVFRAFHEDSPELVDGIARAVAREFTLTGMNRPEVERFIETLVKELGATKRYEWEAVTEILSPLEIGDAGPRVHFASANQRRLALVHFFKRLSRQGPIVLWINDAQWASEALRFVKTLLDQDSLEIPIFILMTARDDLLARSDHHHKKVKAILEYEDARVQELEPLDEPTIRKLVEEALFLDPSAAFHVAKRSGGNPLHALEIVREWIDGDLLQATREGFALSEDQEEDNAPTKERHEVWSGIVDRLVADQGDRRVVLEMGAILGEQFQRSTWRAASAILDLKVDEELIETLLERKFIYKTPMGLVFSQNLFREALFASARENGRWQKLCAACARALEAENTGGVSEERLGFLYIEAGEILEGARRILAGCEVRRLRGEYHPIPYITSVAIKELREHDDNEAKRLFMKLARWRAHAYHVLNENDTAHQWSQIAWETAAELDDRREMALAWVHSAQALNYLGDLAQARSRAEEALAILEGEEKKEYQFGAASASLTLAHIARRQDRFDDAQQFLERGVALSENIGDRVLACNIEFVGLIIRFQVGEKVEREQVDDLIERCKESRTTLGLASALNVRAELARADGDLDQAQEDYRRSEETHSLVDPGRGAVPRINMVLVLLEKGEFVEAGLSAIRIVQNERRKTRPMIRLYALSATFAMRVVRGEFTELREGVQEFTEVFEEIDIGSDSDIAFCLKLALEQWPNKGQVELRKRLEDLLAQVSTS